MKRTSTRVPRGTSAQQALAAAREAKGFERMPGARKRRRGNRGPVDDLEDAAREPDDTDTDLVIAMEELFARDSQPDRVVDAGDLDDDQADVVDAKTAGERLRDQLIEAGENRVKGRFVRLVVQSNGAVVGIGKNGRIAKHFGSPARDEETGQFRSGVKGDVVDEPEWWQATSDDELAAKVQERIEALGASLFQGSQGLSPARRAAMTRAFLNDRSRRSDLEGDARFAIPARAAEALRRWAESEGA